MDLKLNNNTQLKPTAANRLNKRPLDKSPQRIERPGSNGNGGFSPIRRSGSPERRAKIEEYELKHAKNITKKPKSVQFNTDIEVFDKPLSNLLRRTALESPLRSTAIETSKHNSIESLAEEIKEIKSNQAILLQKLDYIISKLDN